MNKKNDYELSKEVQYWAGRLIDNEQNYEIAKEIVDSIKNAEEVVKNLVIHDVVKSLKVDIQNFDLCDCPYQINNFLKKYKIEKQHIIGFTRSDKYLTMIYETF